MNFIARIVSIALLPLLLAACEQKPVPPLVFGAAAWPGYEPLYLAQEQGYLKEVNLRLAEYGGTAEVKKAFLNHELNAAAMPLGEAVQLLHDIPDLKIVLLLDFSNGADAVLAQPGIADLKQLQGRRVGVDSMGRGSYFLELALQSVGMQGGQVETVPLQPAEQEAAFRAHKVDALAAAGAVRSRLQAGGARALFDSSRTPGKLIDVLVVRDNDIGKYHGELTMLVRGWQHALDFIHAQPDQARQFMAQHGKITPDEFAAAMQGVELLGVQRNRELMGGEMPGAASAVDAVQRFLLGRGLISMGADAAALMDTSLLPEDKS